MLACVWAVVFAGVRAGMEKSRRGAGRLEVVWQQRGGIVCVVGGMTWHHDSLAS